MRLLVSTEKTQGQRKNDFCHVPEGEVVNFHFECDGEKVDGGCGCRRSMSGITSHKATTTMLVADRPDITPAKLVRLLVKSYESGGWGSLGAEVIEAAAVDDAKDIAQIAKAFPLGMVIEKRGEKFQNRREEKS